MARYQVMQANKLKEWGVNILLYSTAGRGKTTLAATLADSEYGSPVLIVDADGGAHVISHRADIDVIPVTDLNSAGASGFGWEVIKEISDDLITGKLKHRSGVAYKTIIYDNMSEYIDICVRHVLRTISRNISATDRPDQNDWGKVTSDMLLFTRRNRDYSRNSSTNIIFIAWEYDETNKEGQVLKRSLLFNPALARKIPGIVDIVAILRGRSGNTRELSFAMSEDTDGKFRRNDTEIANQIPETIRWKGKENAPLVAIVETLRGNKPFPIAKYRVSNANTQEKKED